MLNNFNKITAKTIGAALMLLSAQTVFAQDQSPYTRYGLGDLVPNTNVTNRGMGGISAAYNDHLSVNYNNPASYSAFQTYLEGKSKKPISGRVLLDVGINYDSKTIRNPNQTDKFSSSYGYFSHVHLGIPLNKNWGMSFGLRPVSRIGYKIGGMRAINDANDGHFIDSAYVENNGNGGAFLPTFGTGFAIKNLSLGASIGYLFGRREFNTKMTFLNDTVAYNSSNHSTQSYFGGIYFNGGAQYRIKLKDTKEEESFLQLGISGNVQQRIKATQDEVRETIIRDATNGDVRLDSVQIRKQNNGSMIYPASYTAGFILGKNNRQKGNGWMFGADFVKTDWSNFRFFDKAESVQSTWQVRVGGQIRPQPTRNYFSNVAYRAGFFYGPDYVRVDNERPTYGVTFGLGLPLANYNRLTGQATIINLGFEYGQKGNNQNLIKENIFRIAVGLNFSDIWFMKRKYD